MLTSDQTPAVASPQPVANGDGLMTYGVAASTNPRWRPYSNLTDTVGPASKAVAGVTGQWQITRTSPIKQEAISANVSSTGLMQVSCFDGKTWTNEFSAFLGGYVSRRFDIAYETNTGDVMVLWADNGATGANELKYRTKPGTSSCGSGWSTATSLDSANITGSVRWVKMAWDRRASSNLITAIWVDDAQRLSAMQWSGTAWGNEPGAALETSLQYITATQDTEDFDVEYESLSGDVMVVWGNSAGADGTNGVRYATCTGGTSACTWTNVGAPPTFLDDATELDLAANPVTDEMVFASIGSGGSDLQAGVWSGSAWTNTANLDTSTRSVGVYRQRVAVGWLVNGAATRSIVAFNDSGATTVSYYVGNGTSFGTANSPLTYTTTPALADPQARYDIQMDPKNNDRLMLSISDANDDLFMKRLVMDSSGSLTWSASDGGAALETNLSYQGDISFAYWRNTTTTPLLTQQGYLWENDDQVAAATVDSNTAQAAANTAITNVVAGERLTLRTQLTNAGATLPGTDIGLFYDRNDGYWRKVTNTDKSTTSAGTCSDTSFNCAVVDNSAGVGGWSSVATDPTGTPWVSYYDATAGALKVAHFVGTGGNCSGSNSEWDCATIDTGTRGTYSSIGVDLSGTPWVSYYDASGSPGLRVAKFVKTGGNCASSTWTCTLVDAGSVGTWTSLAFDSNDGPWVAYADAGSSAVKVAYNTPGGCASGAWTCTTIETGSYDGRVGLAFDAQNIPWVSYHNSTSGALRVAKGTAGSCGSNLWTCTTVDTGSRGDYTSIAIDPSGAPWVAYYDASSGATGVRVANYVGSGGNCTSSAWNCTRIDSGTYSNTSIGFAPDGKAWVSYFDTAANTVRLARSVGSAGNCTSSAWNCAAAVTSATAGATSIAMSRDGVAWISHSKGGLSIAKLAGSGEIVVAPGKAGSTAAATTATAKVGGGSCLATATFTNGRWSQAPEISQLNVPDGSGATKYCTELSWVIDTTRASPGATYRFVVATRDGNRPDRSLWRGPSSIAQYPTLTLAGATSTTFSKDVAYSMSDCASDAAWGCTTADTSADGGSASSIAISPSGIPWIVYSDTTNTTNNVFMYSYYAGSGAGSCGTNSAWVCGVLDSPASSAVFNQAGVKVAFAPDGAPWVVYYDRGANALLKVAKYVGGTSGSGCNVSGGGAWTCTSVDTFGYDYSANGVTPSAGLAFDSTGAPWVSYNYQTSGSVSILRVARYTGSGGTNCSNTSAWTCMAITDPTLDNGRYNDLAMDRNGVAYVAFRNSSGNNLELAQYVGSGGNCVGSAQWKCSVIEDGDATFDLGKLPHILFDAANTAWISYTDKGTTKRLRIARYVGSNSPGGCSSPTNNVWSCTTVLTSSAEPGFPTLALDPYGNPVVSYIDSSVARAVARYVPGSGSSSCGTANDWICTTLITTTSSYGGVVFGQSGVPWLVFRNSSTSRVIVAKSHLPLGPLTTASVNGAGLRYRLDSGKAPRTESGSCSATAGNTGYCGVATASDGNVDSITAITNERPMYAMTASATSNTAAPVVTWTGKSTVAPSGLVVQAYRAGSTNAWSTITATSNTCSAAAANAMCTFTGTPSGTASDYWAANGSSYVTSVRVYQPANASGSETLTTDAFSAVGNNAPTVSGSLAQYRSDGTTGIATATWINATTVVLKASVADGDVGDTIALCPEVRATSSSFTNSENSSCGTAVTTGSTASVTVTGLSTDTHYHWQVRAKDGSGAYSSWMQFVSGGDAFDVDVAAPSIGSAVVYDGSTNGSDASSNSGSVTSISANWAGFSDGSGSGISSYEYSIGTSQGATDVRVWTSNATTSVTASSLSLQTGQQYYFNVRAIDALGYVSSTVSSNGQFVAPSLTFTVSTPTVSFGQLGLGNSYSATSDVSLTVATNAIGGYSVRQRATAVMTSDGGATIPFLASSTPSVWPGAGASGVVGFASSDTTVNGGGDVFAGLTKFAGIPLTSPGDIIADASNVAGSSLNDTFTVRYRLQGASSTPAGVYRTSVVLTAVPQF